MSAEIRKAFSGGSPADTKCCIKLTESSPVYRTNTRFFVHVVENKQSDRRKNLLTEEDRNAILSLVKQRRYGKSVAPFVVAVQAISYRKTNCQLYSDGIPKYIFSVARRKGFPGIKISDAKGLRSLFCIADFVHTPMATEAPQRADSIAQTTEKGMSAGFRRKEEERYYDRRDF